MLLLENKSPTVQVKSKLTVSRESHLMTCFLQDLSFESWDVSQFMNSLNSKDEWLNSRCKTNELVDRVISCDTIWTHSLHFAEIASVCISISSTNQHQLQMAD